MVFQKKILICILALASLNGCNSYRQECHKQLLLAENEMDTHPGKAIEILDDISENYRTKFNQSEKARYSLLKAMALDKNYIDCTSDSLTAVALNYYKHHGKADDKLKAYYYQAVIYKNRMESESAMACLVRAEQYVSRSEDYMAIARLYSAISTLYGNLWSRDTELYYAKKSESYYNLANNQNGRMRSLLRMANCYLKLNETDSAKLCLDLVEDNLSEVSAGTLSSYYGNKLIYDRSCKVDYKDDLNDYLTYCKEENVDWIHIAGCYTGNGQFEKALEALEKQIKYAPEYKRNPSYLLHKADVLDSLRNYKESLAAYREYSRITDSLDLALYSQDTKFVKERYEAQLEIKEDRIKYYTAIAASAILILILTILIIRLCLRFHRKSTMEQEKKEQLIERYYSIVSERDELKQIIDCSNGPNNSATAEIKSRHDLLNRILLSWIRFSGHLDSKTADEIDKIAGNPQTFISSTRASFEEIYPGYIAFLKKAGLDDKQINICCLYALGMSGKEIRDHLGEKSHYNANLEIRKAFNLGAHDTNLGPFLRQQLKDLDKNQEV